MNCKKHRESTNKLLRIIPPQVTRPGYSLTFSSVLILTQPGEGNSYLTGRGRRTLPVRVLIPKNLITLKFNISFFIEALDEFSTRQVKSLITKIVLETSILSLNIAQFLIRYIIQIEKVITTSLNNLTKGLLSLLIKERRSSLLEK